MGFADTYLISILSLGGLVVLCRFIDHEFIISFYRACDFELQKRP